LGLVLSTLTVHIAAAWATSLSWGRLGPAVTAQAASLGTFGVLWVMQYILCDRFLFRSPPAPAGEPIYSRITSRPHHCPGATRRPDWESEGATDGRLDQVYPVAALKAAWKPGRERSTMASLAVSETRNHPGSSNAAPGSTYTSCSASRAANASSSAIGDRTTT